MALAPGDRIDIVDSGTGKALRRYAKVMKVTVDHVTVDTPLGPKTYPLSFVANERGREGKSVPWTHRGSR